MRPFVGHALLQSYIPIIKEKLQQAKQRENNHGKSSAKITQAEIAKEIIKIFRFNEFLADLIAKSSKFSSIKKKKAAFFSNFLTRKPKIYYKTHTQNENSDTKHYVTNTQKRIFNRIVIVGAGLFFFLSFCFICWISQHSYNFVLIKKTKKN